MLLSKTKQVICCSYDCFSCGLLFSCQYSSNFALMEQKRVHLLGGALLRGADLNALSVKLQVDCEGCSCSLPLPVPQEYLCPISLELMQGGSLERACQQLNLLLFTILSLFAERAAPVSISQTGVSCDKSSLRRYLAAGKEYGSSPSCPHNKPYLHILSLLWQFCLILFATHLQAVSYSTRASTQPDLSAGGTCCPVTGAFLCKTVVLQPNPNLQCRIASWASANNVSYIPEQMEARSNSSRHRATVTRKKIASLLRRASGLLHA